MILSIVQYINITFLIIVLLCGIIGFIRGTLKSGYFMVAMLVVLIIGWILMAPISNGLVNMNLSNYGIVIDGIMVETPMQFVRSFIERDHIEYAFIFEEGTFSLDLIQGVIGLGVKIVYFILLCISSFTIFYLIFGIVWLCTKKPLRKLFIKEYDISLKHKVSFKSRLGGLGIGLTKGLIYMLFIGIILAGVASIGNTIEEVAVSQNEVAIVCVNDTLTLVELSNDTVELENESNETYDEVFEAMKAYRYSVPGKIFGCIKYGKNKTTFDEFMFDSIFSINTEHGNIKLRKELKNVAKILSSDSVKDVMTEGFDINKLYQLDKEELKQIVDLLSDLDIIKVVVPVGIEFVAYSDLLVDEFGADFATIQELIQSKYDELVELDYCNEVKKLGYVFVDVVDLLGEGLADPSKIDFLNLDQETVNQIFNNLNDVELLEVVAPVTINYLLNMDSVKDAIAKTGFTVEDLGLNNDINYVDELMNLPKIYEKLTQIGIKYAEGKMDLSNVDYEKVEGFVESLFDSVIVQNAVPVVATTLVNTYLPEEFSGIFTKEEVENVNWEEEFSPLLTAAVVLLNSGILEAEDKMLALSNLENEKINDLGKYISQSKLFTDNLNEVVESLLKVVLHDSISYNGLDESKGEVWNEQEIVALFNVMKKLASGISFNLSDEEYEDLAVTLTSSKYVKKNLNNIVSALTSGLDITVSGLEDDEWTVNEIYSTFKALSIIMNADGGGNVTLEQMLKLDDQKLNVILESKLVKEILRDFICEKSKPGQSLELLKGVYKDGIDENGNKLYSWDDELIDVQSSYSNGTLTIVENESVIQYNIYKNGRFLMSTSETLVNNLNNNSYTVKGIIQKGEIREVFNAISKLQFEDVNQFNIDLRNVIENKETLLDSYIITLTLIDKLISLDETNGGSIIIPTELMDAKNDAWYGINGELSDTFTSIDYLLEVTTSENPVYIDSLNDKLDSLNFAKIANNKDEILKSKIVSLTIINKIKELNNNGLYITHTYLNDDAKWYSQYDENNHLVKHNELGNLISSLDLIIGDECSLDSIDLFETINTTLDLFENDANIVIILKSSVVCETLKENLLSVKSLSDLGYVDRAFENYNKNVNDFKEWYDFDENGNPVQKELWNLIKGVHLVLNNEDINKVEDYTMEMLIENEALRPKVNDNCEITSSQIGIILKSIVLEEAFVTRVKEFTKEDGYLGLVVNIPNDFKWYRKDVKGSDEYDLQTFIESFYLIQQSFDFTNNKDILSSITNLRKLSQEEVKALGTGMVVSRTFKGSIEKMFNAIMSPEYIIKSLVNNNMKSWNDVKFNASDYDNETKIQARDNFIKTFNIICSELNK